MANRRNQELDDFRRNNLGWIFLRLGQGFFRKSGPQFFKSGHTQLRTSHLGVLVNLPVAGARITDLAAKARVTKQAIGLVVDELERIGYVERVPDPTDGRAKIVKFTKIGLSFLEDSKVIVEGVWDSYAKKFGKRRLKQLHDELADLLETLEEDESSSAIPPQRRAS